MVKRELLALLVIGLSGVGAFSGGNRGKGGRITSWRRLGPGKGASNRGGGGYGNGNGGGSRIQGGINMEGDDEKPDATYDEIVLLRKYDVSVDEVPDAIRRALENHQVKRQAGTSALKKKCRSPSRHWKCI